MPKITAEQFVRTWQKSNSVKEVCTELDIPEQYAYSKAKTLRDKGVPLKKFENSRSLDYAALAELAKDLA